MAADKAVVSVTASLLPDEIKIAVGGNTTYDLNDVGNNNKWIYSLNTVAAASQDAILASIPFIGTATATVNSTDDVVFLFVKHTGTTDGSTATTATLSLNLSAGTVTGSAVGDIILNANECFFARLGNTEINDVNAISSSGNIQAMLFAIVDDGGV